MVGFNTPLRFLKDGSWRKGTEDLRMYSPETGAMFRFDSDNDIVFLTTSYSPIRLVIVVKEKDGGIEVFCEKLLLLTSLKNVVVASALNKVFDRNFGRNTAKTSLIIATSANTQVDLQVSMAVYVPGSDEIRQFALRYDAITKKFLIPEGLNTETIARANSNNVILPSAATDQVALYSAGGPFPWDKIIVRARFTAFWTSECEHRLRIEQYVDGSHYFFDVRLISIVHIQYEQ